VDRKLFKKERQTVENDEIYLFLSDEGCRKFNTVFEKQNNRKLFSINEQMRNTLHNKRAEAIRFANSSRRGKITS
jgi:hypothetical protein